MCSIIMSYMLPKPSLPNTHQADSQTFKCEQVKNLINRIEEVQKYVQFTHTGSIMTMVGISVVWISCFSCCSCFKIMMGMCFAVAMGVFHETRGTSQSFSNALERISEKYPNHADYVIWSRKGVEKELVEIWKGFCKDLKRNTLVFGFLIDKDLKDVTHELEKRVVSVPIGVQRGLNFAFRGAQFLENMF